MPAAGQASAGRRQIYTTDCFREERVRREKKQSALPVIPSKTIGIFWEYTLQNKEVKRNISAA
jgi:hypothetical protein